MVNIDVILCTQVSYTYSVHYVNEYLGQVNSLTKSFHIKSSRHLSSIRGIGRMS